MDVDSLSRRSLKDEARAWRAARAALGETVTQGAALERVARAHGFRDWNTACAALPEDRLLPLLPGERVRGTYLGAPFEGVVKGTGTGLPLPVTIQFDAPVQVASLGTVPVLRRRVTVPVDQDGTSPGRTSDGTPHLRIERA